MNLAPRLARNQAFNSKRTLFTRARAPQRTPLATGLYTTAAVLSAGLFVVYYLDARSAIHRYLITPCIRYFFDPETGHKIALRVLRSGFAPKDHLPDDERLHFKLWGQNVTNPIGVAAGFDKNGEAIDGLFNLGFSWVEIGSVTPKPQEGNPRPRVFNLSEDSAVINRYGFPSLGHSYVLSRLMARLPKYSSPSSEHASMKDDTLLAVNLGKNKQSPLDSVDDYVTGVRMFGTHSDVLVINVSSPNTPGLRDLQSRRSLELLLFSVCKARDQVPTTRKPKLVLKIAPDLTENQVKDMASVIRVSGIDGVIVSNTTVQRPESLASASKMESGGLSGAPLKPLSLSVLRTMRSQLPASIPIIGCGGIMTASDALEYADAGAAMVQVYTGFGYDGPGACRRLKDDLATLLEQRGTTWEAVSDSAVARLSWKPSAKDKEQKLSVSDLIEEARQIGSMLDDLDLRLSES